MSATKHTPGPFAFRIAKNGRDYEIVAPCLRPEWVGSGLEGQPVVVATVSCGDFTDATGAARELNEANARLMAAAPELLEALLHISNGMADAETCRKIARAALAKAGAA